MGGADLRKHWYDLFQRVFCLCSLLGVFMVSCLMFKALSHFKFIFVYGESVHSNFIDFHAAVQLPQHHFVEETVFLLVYILASFVKDELGHRCVGLFLDCLILFH